MPDISTYFSFHTEMKSKVVIIDENSPSTTLNVSCAVCTFRNIEGRTKCDMCGAALQLLAIAEVVDLTADEVQSEDALLSIQPESCDNEDLHVYEEEDFLTTGIDSSRIQGDVSVLEVSGRRFGDIKKRGKNTFCGKKTS